MPVDTFVQQKHDLNEFLTEIQDLVKANKGSIERAAEVSKVSPRDVKRWVETGCYRSPEDLFNVVWACGYRIESIIFKDEE